MVGYGSFLPVNDAFVLARKALPSLARVGIAWNPAESNSRGLHLEGARVVQGARDHAARGEHRRQRGHQRGHSIAGLARRAGAVRRRRQHDDVGHRQRHRDVEGASDPRLHDHAGRAGPRDALRRRARLPRARARERRARRARAPRRGPGHDSDSRRAGRSATAARRERARAGRAEGRLAAARRRARGGDGAGRRYWRPHAGGAIVGAARQEVEGRVRAVQQRPGRRGVAGRRAGRLQGGRAWSRAATIETVVRNAQGDMATVSALVDAAVGDGADLLLTFSTPTLQAAIQRGGKLAHRLHVRGEPDRGGRGQDRHRSPAERHRRLHAAGATSR